MKPKFHFWIIVIPLILYLATFFGCASAPLRESLPVYDINGASYYSLSALCSSRNISWEYDTFTKIAVLNKNSHRVNLMVGDNMALVDGSPLYMKHPADIYQGMLVVSSGFKEQVIDTLFRNTYPSENTGWAASRIKKVVVDAGHGGNDPGAIGRTGLREKDVNLDIAKRLSKILQSQGIEVILTRSSDRFIPLERRAAIANNSGADLFISVHSNANRVRSMSGFEVYYVANSVSDSKRAQDTSRSKELNLKNAYIAGNSSDLKNILWDMIYTNSRAESIELSHSICRVMTCNLDSKILGIKGARYEVLREIRMPGVLIETGFLSNLNEENMLKNGYYRQKIAQAVAQGIMEYSKGARIMEVSSR